MTDKKDKSEVKEKEDNTQEQDSGEESLVDRADSSAEKLAKENERMEKNIKKLQELEARKTLGGKSEAGEEQKEEEISNEEYAKKALAGEVESKE